LGIESVADLERAMACRALADAQLPAVPAAGEEPIP
jgi:hypothetical protein